jgi:amino acid transporter
MGLNEHQETKIQPTTHLSLLDAVALIVGIVVGVGIFKTPSQVAANVNNEIDFLLVWLGGGLISLIGALCYGELASTYPHVGGEYHYLSRAWGKMIAWLFAWSRLMVIQTGSIAILAFVFGDYLSELLPLGQYSSSIYAALAIVFLSIINGWGIKFSQWTQNSLSAAKILGLLLIVVTGLMLISTPTSREYSSAEGSYGLALIFVLFTYGGWTEAAYIAAELDRVQRNMTKSLIISISLITTIFLLINLAYLKGLGLNTLAQSETFASDLMTSAIGEGGAHLISLLIAIAVFGSINGTIFTGARTNYALGQQEKNFAYLGVWHQQTQTPVNAIRVQAIIALGLVFLGTLTRSGFVTIVEYTAPVFWFFLLLVGLSLMILRYKEPLIYRPFLVPFYPFTPLLFCMTGLYMFYASIMYTGKGALWGVLMVLTGVPLWLKFRFCDKKSGFFRSD